MEKTRVCIVVSRDTEMEKSVSGQQRGKIQSSLGSIHVSDVYRETARRDALHNVDKFRVITITFFSN